GEGREAGGCVGDREEHELVKLSDASLVPVARVPDKIDADARLEVLHLEGPGADRRLGELRPAACLLEGRRAHVEKGGENVGEIGDGARRREFDGGVVDLAITILGKVGGTAAVDSGALRVELRRALLASPVDI